MQFIFISWCKSKLLFESGGLIPKEQHAGAQLLDFFSFPLAQKFGEMTFFYRQNCLHSHVSKGCFRAVGS